MPVPVDPAATHVHADLGLAMEADTLIEPPFQILSYWLSTYILLAWESFNLRKLLSNSEKCCTVLKESLASELGCRM